MPGFILALLTGLGGLGAQHAEHTARGRLGDLSKGEGKRGGCCEPTDTPEEDEETERKGYGWEWREL